jgi:hypothetical protein
MSMKTLFSLLSRTELDVHKKRESARVDSDLAIVSSRRQRNEETEEENSDLADRNSRLEKKMIKLRSR